MDFPTWALDPESCQEENIPENEFDGLRVIVFQDHSDKVVLDL
jgi:hypothetical protein